MAQTPTVRRVRAAGREDDDVMDATATATAPPPSSGPSPSGTPLPPPTLGPAPRPIPPRRPLDAGRVVALVVGCLLLFPGLGLAVGGGAALVGAAAMTDGQGYVDVTLDRLGTDGVAIVTDDITLGADWRESAWVLDWLDVDLRFRVDGARSTDEVFVGIARSDDVRAYLAGTRRAEIVDVDGRTVRYRVSPGRLTIDPPSEQHFWEASSTGAGEQELVWPARGGRWAIVVMNADGSPVVAADADVAARSGALVPFAVTLVVAGVVTLITATVLIVVGARNRRGAASEPS